MNLARVGAVLARLSLVLFAAFLVCVAVFDTAGPTSAGWYSPLLWSLLAGSVAAGLAGAVAAGLAGVRRSLLLALTAPLLIGAGWLVLLALLASDWEFM